MAGYWNARIFLLCGQTRIMFISQQKLITFFCSVFGVCCESGAGVVDGRRFASLCMHCMVLSFGSNNFLGGLIVLYCGVCAKEEKRKNVRWN